MAVSGVSSPSPSQPGEQGRQRRPSNRLRVTHSAGLGSLFPWLRPDTKTQVTIEYKKEGGATIPLRVDTVVISTQHADSISTEDLRSEILNKIVKAIIPANLLDERTIYHVGCIFIYLYCMTDIIIDSTFWTFRHWRPSRRCWFDWS